MEGAIPTSRAGAIIRARKPIDAFRGLNSSTVDKTMLRRPRPCGLVRLSSSSPRRKSQMRKTVIVLLGAFGARRSYELVAKLEPLSSQLRVPAKYWMTGFSVAFTSSRVCRRRKSKVLTDSTSHRDPGEIISAWFPNREACSRSCPMHERKPRRNFSGVKLYDAQEEEASQQEKNKFFIGGFSVLKLCTFQFKNPYRFIDTDLATMLQAAALDAVLVKTRSLRSQDR